MREPDRTATALLTSTTIRMVGSVVAMFLGCGGRIVTATKPVCTRIETMKMQLNFIKTDVIWNDEIRWNLILEKRGASQGRGRGVR